MPVGKMLDSMSAYELLGWKLLFEVKGDEEERRSSMRKGGNGGDDSGGGFG